MAKLTLADCEKTAGRGRPWTFRLEFHGTTANGNPSAKFWYATGRGLSEPVEIGWGAIGATPTYQLIDWAELRTRVADKLNKGYDYAFTDYVRMSAANFAKVTGGSIPAPVAAPPVIPTSVAQPPVTPPPAQAPVVAAPTPVLGAKYTKTPSQSLLALGEPYSLIRALKILREGTKITGYAALDESGDELMQLDATEGREFATEHDVEIEFA